MKPLVTKNQKPQQTSYSLKTVPQTLGEMEKLLVLLLLISGCNSQAQDLSGKVLVFPKRSYSDYVTLKPNKTDGGLKAMTVCLRFISGDKNEQSLFSTATSGHHNTPLLQKYADRYEVYMRATRLLFYGLPNELNKWHSYCFTWESITGLVQLWVDGVGSMKQMAYKSGSVEANPSIILGQDQDNVGGGFSSSESFVGNIKDVHVWDYVISDCEVQHYTGGSGFKYGNVIDWKTVNYADHGDVVVEKTSQC